MKIRQARKINDLFHRRWNGWDRTHWNLPMSVFMPQHKVSTFVKARHRVAVWEFRHEKKQREAAQ